MAIMTSCTFHCALNIVLNSIGLGFFQVFFYKACFLGGTINLGTEYQDYAWVTREEMKDFVNPEYYKTVSRFVRWVNYQNIKKDITDLLFMVLII